MRRVLYVCLACARCCHSVCLATMPTMDTMHVTAHSWRQPALANMLAIAMGTFMHHNPRSMCIGCIALSSRTSNASQSLQGTHVTISKHR